MTQTLSRTGTILRGIGGFYTVLDEAGNACLLRAQAKLRRDKLTPMVGDVVEFIPGEGEDEGWLTAILPRKNRLTRPSVANIDEFVIVVAAAMPKIDAMLVDRLLISAARANMSAAICVNKCDLSADEAREIARQYAGAGVKVLIASARTGAGVSELRAHLSGKTHAFGGQSGAGKSSLINALYALKLETGGMSARIERGKHTTRRCELICVDGGGRVLDTPGFSLLETDLIEPRELGAMYPEFAPHAGDCRFSPCYHAGEPDCAVKAAVERGDVPGARYKRYLEILSEMRERWKNRYD